MISQVGLEKKGEFQLTIENWDKGEGGCKNGFHNLLLNTEPANVGSPNL